MSTWHDERGNVAPIMSELSSEAAKAALQEILMNTLRWISIGLFSIVAVFFIWFGVTYATVSDMLWFHEAAVPEVARDAVRPLYFALMTLIGGASIALGVLSLYVIAVPLRRGAPGAGAVLVLASAVALILAAITAEKLAAATGSPTSWHIMGIVLTTSLIAFALNALAGRSKAARQPAG